MKTKLIFTFIFISTFTIHITAQEWNGSSNIDGTIMRNGIVGIGLTNPPNDTQLYVKSNLKVGIVNEVNHSIDYQFGILSAVNRSNTKAFAVSLLQGGNYTDTFNVMGDGRVIAMGDVSIGTSQQPYFANGFTLSVHGKAIAEEVQVQLAQDWPDYVFKEDYSLMSLDNLENFIKTNYHLPNIPSSQEVKDKNGIELGIMNAKLLEKIEELTLYTIQLKKELDELKNELTKIKNP